MQDNQSKSPTEDGRKEEEKGEMNINNNKENIDDDTPTPETSPFPSPSPNNNNVKLSSNVGSGFKSIKDAGISFDKNSRYRRTMEDGHSLVDSFADVEGNGFFAIYDGHGGRGAVDFVEKNLPPNLLREYKDFQQFPNKFPNSNDAAAANQSDAVVHDENSMDVDSAQSAQSAQSGAGDIWNYGDVGGIEGVLKRAFLTTDKGIADAQIQFSGTTCVVGLLLKDCDTSERKLLVANCGDARGVISRKGDAVRLSYDHKGTDSEESKRITNLGGFMVLNRVNGILAVTRSLGDAAMKDYVTGEPYITETVLQEGDNILILACDGLWDVCTDQEAIDLLLKEPEDSAQSMSDKLLLHALKNGSTDNISVMVILL